MEVRGGGGKCTQKNLHRTNHMRIRISAVASNRPTEALASVISFTFVVYSHYKHS